MRILILDDNGDTLEDWEIFDKENLKNRKLETVEELASEIISTLENTYDME